MKTPSSHRSHHTRRLQISTALLILGSVHSQAACGSGSISITNLPHLGGSYYTASALNASGQITGYSFLPGDTEEHAFLFGVGGLVDLGTLGGSSSYGFALNDSGHVVGESTLAGDSAPTHAFLFSGAPMLDLGTLGVISSPVGINNAGQVAGFSIAADNSVEAFLYSNGNLTGLGHFGGGMSRPNAINQSGQVVGSALTELFEQRAFAYANGVLSNLGTLGGFYSTAFDINDNNMIVGESLLPNDETRGFIYSNGVMTDVGTLGGTYSTAFQINNAGQVIGMATTEESQLTGFIYSGGLISNLGTLGGVSSTPNDINNAGQIVGKSDQADGSSRAFLWQAGTMTDLNTLLPANSGWVLDNAYFINDAGRIVGSGVFNELPQWFILDLGGNNNPPSASAGNDQSTDCSGVAMLDGSLSSDPDGDALSFEWSENGVVLGTNTTLSALFAAGTHTITLTVTDSCGASAQDTVVITGGGDTTPPTISCPGSVTAADRNGCEARVPDLRSQVVVSDNCTPANALIISQSPAAGTLLGSGQYPVTVTVTDAAGNSASCTTTVTVGDDKPPVIICVPGPISVSANENGQAKVPHVTKLVAARDNCTPAKSLLITQTPAAGTLLEQGSHSILVTVTDGAGNSTSKNVTLRIKDRTAPKIHSVTATPSVLTPANGKTVNVEVKVNATDNCDSSPTSKIVEILCDEPTSRGDIKITGNLTAKLAAAANSRGNGRIYRIIISCRDDAGNTSHKSVVVYVPKSKRDH